jgi:hypothetical protein
MQGYQINNFTKLRILHPFSFSFSFFFLWFSLIYSRFTFLFHLFKLIFPKLPFLHAVAAK